MAPASEFNSETAKKQRSTPVSGVLLCDQQREFQNMMQPPTFVSPLARVARSQINGETVYFTIGNPDDLIQSTHLRGAFYEEQELEIIKRYFPIGGRFCDIGANVGNHTLFLAKFLHARAITIFEPNPAVIPLLRSNIMLNGIDEIVDMRYLGYGLSDREVCDAAISTPDKDNMGHSKIADTGGSIPLITGDKALAGRTFDLIKIDVEGMEMKVLEGLEGHLQSHPTPMFIEIDNENIDPFHAWMKRAGYEKKDEFRRYEANTNYLVVPM
jgi:FkbM family methyltransferase